MKPKRTVLLTFDYELFLGDRSGTPEACLLRPTESILTLLQQFSLKGIFFIDTNYLLRLKDLSFKDDLAKIKKQLIAISQQGHYIFPHIHPHWMDAEYLPESGQWSLADLSHYTFGSISLQEREDQFNASMEFLQDIIRDSGSRQTLNGYRAGGWSIQPFSDFQPFFEKHGIVNDFSVLPGFKYESQAQSYDFLKTPAAPVYRFSSDVLTSEPSGPFTEWTISSFKVSAYRRLLNKIELRLLPSTRLMNGDGRSVEGGGKHHGHPELQMVSLELLTHSTLPLFKRFLFQNSYMQIISHPKMMSSHNFSNFKKLLNWMTHNFTIETDFQKYDIE